MRTDLHTKTQLAMPPASQIYSIGFLGPAGSFSHKAAERASSALAENAAPPIPTDSDLPLSQPGTHTHNHKLVPLSTLPSCYDGVHTGDLDLGVAPVENSTNGPVVAVWDVITSHFLRQATQDDPAGIAVVGEVYVPIQFCLLGRRNNPDSESAQAQQKGEDDDELSDLSHIKTITTHPQSWTQCSRFLSKLQNVALKDAPSNSEAARIAMADQSGSVAAISSISNARELGLDVLSQNIQDSEDNQTRFWIVSREQHQSKMADLLQGSAAKDLQFKKALLGFQPGMSRDELAGDRTHTSLLKTLKVFDEPNFVTLLGLFSRPTRKTSWDLVYFAEIRLDVSDSPKSEAYASALAQVSHLKAKLVEAGCVRVGCMGIWSASPLIAGGP